jgi:hypothetical protein
METLLVSYDLGGPESSADYKVLGDYLRSFGKYAKPLESFWLIKTDLSCVGMRDKLQKLVDSNDKVLVMRVTGDEWKSYNLGKEIADWLVANL